VCLCVEKTVVSVRPYLEHLRKAEDLTTSHEAVREGFIAIALEKNRYATPLVEAARTLQHAASKATTPLDLLEITGIEPDLLSAAGLSDKAISHLTDADKREAINRLIREYLEPAGRYFVEELVYRFLLTKGDTLGGTMRNIGGTVAQRKLTRAIISVLTQSDTGYRWQDARTRKWFDASPSKPDIENQLRGISWSLKENVRTLIYNLTVPIVMNNVDVCLFNITPEEFDKDRGKDMHTYLALGELKGGIDPAGADEHWKTARTALERIRNAFTYYRCEPKLFFIGAAIERKMAAEIWTSLEEGLLCNAANLTDNTQLSSLVRWLCDL
jgi:hypothetical protein